MKHLTDIVYKISEMENETPFVKYMTLEPLIWYVIKHSDTFLHWSLPTARFNSKPTSRRKLIVYLSNVN